MLRKILVTAISAGFLLTGLGLVLNTGADDAAQTINVKIQEDSRDGIWRVRDNNGNNRGTLKARSKDRINWQAQGSDMVFMFKDNVGSYFTYEEGQFSDGHTQSISNNDMLRLTIRDDAPADTLTYRVYVVSADTFVVGNSPPRVIIF